MSNEPISTQPLNEKEEHEDALIYLKRALTVQQKLGNKENEGAALNDIGEIYFNQGDYETALSYFTQALKTRQQVGDKSKESEVLIHIANIYQEQENYEAALSYQKQALAIQRQIGDKEAECATLLGMGTCYSHNHQVQDGVEAWTSMYVIAKEIQFVMILDALANTLAPLFNMPKGLDGWENLAKQMQSGKRIDLEQFRGKGCIQSFVESVLSVFG